MAKSHKDAIVKALRGKGFGKKAASSIAKATIRRMKPKPSEYVTNWRDSLSAELADSYRAKERNSMLRKQAAINIPSTTAGKIVVIPPKISTDKVKLAMDTQSVS